MAERWRECLTGRVPCFWREGKPECAACVEHDGETEPEAVPRG